MYLHNIYKAKEEGTDRWVCGELIEDGYRLGDCCIRERIVGGHQLIPVVPDTISGCIGILDKNQSLICTGEIIRDCTEYQEDCDCPIYIVLYDQKHCSFVARDINGRVWRLCADRQYEIIGNIYDDKDLVKEFTWIIRQSII